MAKSRPVVAIKDEGGSGPTYVYKSEAQYWKSCSVLIPYNGGSVEEDEAFKKRFWATLGVGYHGWQTFAYARKLAKKLGAKLDIC